MEEILRKLLLESLIPLSTVIGKIKIPHHHRTNDITVQQVSFIAQHGDVLLSRNQYELTNLFIEGFYKHAAISITIGGIKFVLEAVAPLVRIVPLDWWVLHHDFVRVLDPTFLTPDQKLAYPFHALRLIGRPYDYCFEPGIKALYCAEAVTWAINEEYKGDSPWKHREYLGVDTTLPQDFSDSSKFRCVYRTC